MADKQERRDRQRRFATLSSQERRAVVRSVNRGQPVEQRKHAEHAVHIARRQMRFWSLSWLIGPVVGLAQVAQLGWQVALLNALVAALALGAMSAFFYTRARRALQANLARLSKRDAARLGDEDAGRGRGSEGHLPRTAGTEVARRPEPGERPTAGERPLPPERRPYQPRGRKRRGKG
ncbi:MAG: hypothetical protein ACNA8R_11645 [Nitriliruptoraceae bacterium]